MFDCHVNVEVCSTIQAVKYLYKYVYKGHDRISFNVVKPGEQRAVDEIDQFQSGRWVSPCEAAWRIFGFDLYEMHPVILPLQVHLPNMHTVQIRPHERLDVVVAADKHSRTSLTEFFRVNAATPDDTGCLYNHFTESPSEGERYFLRLLLVHVPGPKSFEDLLTVAGYTCATFQEATLKRNLLEEDESVDLCLAEACFVQMPGALRSLFATILIFCQPSNPSALCLKYYAALSEDFSRRFPDSEAKIKQLTARSVEQSLEEMGKSLKTFGLDHLLEPTDDELARTRDIIDSLDAPIPDHCIRCRESLNPAQQEAFTCIIDHVKQKKPGALFIDGPGGTGKTFLYNALYAEIHLMGPIVLPTATSGIAAANIPSGRTTHSRFKIPIDTEASLGCDVPKQGSVAALIKETTLIIWDEASMARKENIKGDFRQVLPVLPHRTQREAVDVSLTAENNYVQLPSEVLKPLEDGRDPITDLTSLTFPELDLRNFTSDIFTTRAILTPMNDDVDSINTELIKKFPRQPVMYKIFDMVLDDNCNVYPTEFINTLCPGGMSPHELVLKEGSPVILLRNILPSPGLCNGTRLICKGFSPNLIECVIITGHHKEKHVFIPRVKQRPSPSSKYPIFFQRKQFPVKLSFAMTINKSQGQTLS
ncbi:uncharacterized protein [Spinacia oleracea]|uniref:ATP-dependent DNA helicase n=1 Tax=Spinacia oleracea TaxID=3562 RepID=A0ABM3R8H3_SPIOL|nr:uncharacterized protein LOC110795137 [Spinacia oleracea]